MGKVEQFIIEIPRLSGVIESKRDQWSEALGLIFQTEKQGKSKAFSKTKDPYLRFAMLLDLPATKGDVLAYCFDLLVFAAYRHAAVKHGDEEAALLAESMEDDIKAGEKRNPEVAQVFSVSDAALGSWD